MTSPNDAPAQPDSHNRMTPDNRRSSLLEAQPAHPGDVPLNFDFPGGTSQPVDNARAQIKALAAELRAHEIMLFMERERYRDAIEQLRQEIVDLRGHIGAKDQECAELRHQQAALYGSTSWRITMPLRMAVRVMKGEWRDVKRIIAAKFK